MLDLEDSVKPDEAQRQYTEYLSSWFGSQLRAEFESCKHDDEIKARYDPRSLEKGIADRNEEAKQSATSFDLERETGKYDPNCESFNQGALDLRKASKAADTDEAMVSTHARKVHCSEQFLLRSLWFSDVSPAPAYSLNCLSYSEKC